MKTLSIDIETFSSVSLKDCGVYAYTESPDFTILMLSYKFGRATIHTVDLTTDELPKDFLAALYDPEILKTAANANFERVCLAKYLNQPMPPEQWQCTLVLAKYLGLPGNLAQLGGVLGLPEDQQKMKTGKELIKYFSVPCKPTKANGGRLRNLPEHDPEKWDQFLTYNAGDVATEVATLEKLSRFEFPQKEQQLWVLDQTINDRGVKVDLVLANQAIRVDTHIKEGLIEQAYDLTGLDNPKSDAQIKGWIQQVTGKFIESLNKKAIPEVREVANSELVDDMLNIRASLAKTSIGKYSAMIRTACEDSRIRGLTQFYGARTGRWAGRLVQLQNLPQNKMDESVLDIARQLVKNGNIESLEALFDDVAGTLSQLIRTAFIPEKGKKLVVADFNAIEACVLAWLANEEWRLDVFRTHGKIYEASAEQMFNLPPGSVGKSSPERQKGKVAELALGYGGSAGALINMGALDMGLKERELKPLVNTWRAANTAITKFWWANGDAARSTVLTRTPTTLKKGISYRRQGPLLKLRLPSGRELAYVKPKMARSGITFEGTLTGRAGAWGRVESYGPKLVENIVQAVARDCLADAMLAVETAGYPIIFHVHDEIVCEVPENIADEALADILKIMGRELPWAEGLPLKAEGYTCNYYMKR